MLSGIKSFFRRLGGSPSDSALKISESDISTVEAPEPLPKPVTTWQERAAAVGALVEPGQKPSYTPISLSPSTKPRRQRRSNSSSRTFPENPLHIPPRRLHLYFAKDPKNIYRYEAAKSLAKRLGTVDGRHYSSYFAEVKSLMASQDYDVAIGLLLRIVDAAERQFEYEQSYLTPAWHGLLADAYVEAGRADLALEINDRYVQKSKKN